MKSRAKSPDKGAVSDDDVKSEKSEKSHKSNDSGGASPNGKVAKSPRAKKRATSPEKSPQRTRTPSPAGTIFIFKAKFAKNIVYKMFKSDKNIQK